MLESCIEPKGGKVGEGVGWWEGRVRARGLQKARLRRDKQGEKSAAPARVKGPNEAISAERA